MISVVIPLYNKESQIAKTLQTVLNQSFQDFEIVVVNDGSTDNGVAEVEKFTDPRIRLVSQPNAGVSAARNRGIAEARGALIALLDADDEWKPEYLSTQMMLTERYSGCDVFAVNYEFCNKQGETTPTIIRHLPFSGEHGILSNYFEVASTSHPPICSISIVARKKAFQSIGGFPVGVKSGEDLLTWARLACRYKIAYSRKALAIFKESESDSNESKAKQRRGGEQYVLDELLKLYSSFPSRYLKDYVLRWYKIYCVLLIECEENRKIFNLAIQAIRLGGKLPTFCALSLFSLFPPKLSRWMFFKLRR